MTLVQTEKADYITFSGTLKRKINLITMCTSPFIHQARNQRSFGLPKMLKVISPI